MASALSRGHGEWVCGGEVRGGPGIWEHLPLSSRSEVWSLHGAMLVRCLSSSEKAWEANYPLAGLRKITQTTALAISQEGHSAPLLWVWAAMLRSLAP
jgi:hypothetical protein